MITKTALVGLAHFLMQADPQTAQSVVNQLPFEQSQQVIQLMEQKEVEFTRKLEFKIKNNQKFDGKVLASPSQETSSGI